MLASIGLETKNLILLIIEHVKKHNEDLNLDIKKVKVYLNLSKFNKSKN